VRLYQSKNSLSLQQLKQDQAMSALQLTTTTDRFLISMDRSVIKREALLRLLELFRLELLAGKVDFDPSIEELGEEIVADWWNKNKESYLKPVQ